MVILSNNDMFEVRINSLLADYDRETLTTLYQPIIGFKAVSLYFTLLTEANNQKINPIISHRSLFTRMQISAGEFVDARKLLEATGLLKTFVSEMKDNKLYQYELYAPKTPKLFFDNTLLYGMLMKSLGELEANKIKSIYLVNRKTDGKEITASFVEVFAPDLDDPIFRKAMLSNEPTQARQSAKLNSGFSYELFFKYLTEHSQINEKAISKQDMKEIERLATLYGISEERAADGVIKVYNPHAERDKRIDFEELTKRFEEETNYLYLQKRGSNRGRNRTTNGNTDLAHKVNLMETLSPKDYLSVLQNGSVPASADLKIINDISKKFRLPNCVINAIIDYVLTVNDNILSKAFCEKIAGSLAREGITTTIDAMDYLKKVSSKGRKKNTKSNYTAYNPSPIDNDEAEESEPVEEEVSISREELLKQLMEDDDNGEN